MKIHFYKYQATGNDFVLIDNRSGKYAFSTDQIKSICDRKFGIGADGIMLIEKHPSLHFNLQYYNSDGTQSLCGNGSRAAVNLASSLGLVNEKAEFQAFDGPHFAELKKDGIVRLKMNDVSGIRKEGDDFLINTGSPHLIRFVGQVKNYPVFETGKAIRNSEKFAREGINVNFVEIYPQNLIFVRTYERGVEDETLSCGTGVTASALAAATSRQLTSPINVLTRGGQLQVEFKSRQSDLSPGQPDMFEEIYLVGPAKLVFEGDLEL